ncbi:UvrD-helicase domain-containing protein [Rhizobium sp.]|uniref:ATP-dependent helicase n=1 Tax=Rhizobium sp. TaxID=391 RepID=UPI000E9D4A34|nr:DNA helicase UvrD [Rhizobium sp.]
MAAPGPSSGGTLGIAARAIAARDQARAPDYLSGLNPEQRDAVETLDGPVLVLAGAGTGKTRVLTTRIAHILETGRAFPSQILAVTFTNKAAREMLERVDALLPDRTAGLWGGTFHSIGNRILRRHAEAAGYRTGFSILDREDESAMLQDVITALGLGSKSKDMPKEKRFPKGEVVADILSFGLNTGLPLEDVLIKKYPHFLDHQEPLEAVGKEYIRRKKAANALDFDDLLTQPLRLLENDVEIGNAYRDQFQFILVDEYQDTNRLQANFIDVLARGHHNIMVVGDDAQSIYSWRGANFQNILQFPKRYPGAKVYKIETNYRSIPEVLDVANAAIAANEGQFEKTLAPARASSGVKPALVALENPNDQARFVAQRIAELNENGTDLRRMAVLYRAHYHSMELQMELTRAGIPFSITSGLRFFEQAHIKDVAAFLKFAVNPRDEVAFKRMARLLQGVGERSAAQLWTAIEKGLPATGAPASFYGLLMPEKPLKVPAKAQKGWQQLSHTLEEIAPGGMARSPAEMLNSVIEAVYDDYLAANFPNYDARKEDLNTLVNYSRQFQDPFEFLDQLALMTGLDTEETRPTDDSDAVTLSSIHQAKGLEWSVVFVVWMTEGMFPTMRSLEDSEALEEERRLFYVAVTRAEDELYLTYPLMRLNAGYGEMIQRPSRFLGEIPKERMEEWQVM